MVARPFARLDAQHGAVDCAEEGGQMLLRGGTVNGDVSIGAGAAGRGCLHRHQGRCGQHQDRHNNCKSDAHRSSPSAIH